MRFLRKRVRLSSLRRATPIELTVAGMGDLVMDARAIIRLRSAAAEVGSSGIELTDRKGDLVIVLSFPDTNRVDADSLVQRFRDLARLDSTV
jgi:hypothetical protein